MTNVRKPHSIIQNYWFLKLRHFVLMVPLGSGVVYIMTQRFLSATDPVTGARALFFGFMGTLWIAVGVASLRIRVEVPPLPHVKHSRVSQVLLAFDNVGRLVGLAYLLCGIGIYALAIHWAFNVHIVVAVLLFGTAFIVFGTKKVVLGRPRPTIGLLEESLVVIPVGAVCLTVATLIAVSKLS